MEFSEIASRTKYLHLIAFYLREGMCVIRSPVLDGCYTACEIHTYGKIYINAACARADIRHLVQRRNCVILQCVESADNLFASTVTFQKITAFQCPREKIDVFVPLPREEVLIMLISRNNL